MRDEVDAFVRLDEKFFAEFDGEISWWVGPSLTADERHGQENLSDVDPPSPWRDWHPVREQPELGRYWVDNVPLTDTEYAQPELRPVRPIGRTSHLMKKSTSFHHSRIFWADAQNAKYGVIHRRAEHTTQSFDVQSPPTIFPLSREQVVLDLNAMRSWNWRLGDIPSDDQAGE